MENTVLLYEPAITKFLLRIPQMDKITRSVLMEDYFIPKLIGRAFNWRSNDESWSGNFWIYPGDDINNRSDAIDFIEFHKPAFIIKTLETQPLIRRMGEVFPGCKVINCIRNGNSVIGSTMKKGWYTDSWLDSSVIDHVAWSENCKTPWYIPARLRPMWLKADVITRTAFVWAYLAREGIWNDCIDVRYEDVLTMPDAVINRLANILQLTPTDLTNTHRSAALGHQERQYGDFSENIAEPWRSYYLKTMKMLNYG